MDITQVTQVTRINPQTLTAVPVVASTVGPIVALFTQLGEYGYTTTNQTGAAFPGGSRLVISHASGAADQVVYFDDVLLVANATYDPTSGTWTVSATTQVSCYGAPIQNQNRDMSALAGTVADFDAAFTAAGS